MSITRQVVLSILGVMTLMCLGAFAGDSDSLCAGVYQIKMKDKLIDYYKLQKQNDTLMVSEKKGDAWETPKPLKPMSAQDIGRMLAGMGGEGIKRGYMAQGISIFVVKEGFKMGELECHSGYMAFSMLGPIELHKKKGCNKK